jgi:glycosyltransferase involved in cell wall biosynthesis
MVPAHNEEASIGDVIRRIPRDFGRCKARVLVIDDGSTDKTAAVAKENGADWVVSLGARRGLGRAFGIGLSEALSHGADILVLVDADGQYDPEQIPELVEPVERNLADLVLGSRFSGWIEEMPFGKRFGNRVATMLTSYLAGIDTTDAQTGFRAFSRDAAMRLNIFGGYNHAQQSLIQAAHKNLRIAEVPVNFRKRLHGKSRLIGSLPGYAHKAGLTTLRAYRDYRPLPVFLTIGGLLFLAGMAVGFRVLIHFVQTGQVTPYVPSAILTAVLLILGFQAIFLGLLADMLGGVRTLAEEVLYLVRSQKPKE